MKKTTKNTPVMPKTGAFTDFVAVLSGLFGSAKKNGKEQQTLSNNSFLRYFSFASLYFAQGVPQGISFYALPTWLATHGYSASEIGTYGAIVTLPWSFKIIAAPLMDRFTYKPMGRRRPWLIFGQLGIILGLVLLSSVTNPEQNISSLMWLGFTVSLFGIFQDVAIDGMAIDSLPDDQQARANGLMWGSKIIGIAAATMLTSTLLDSWGFSSAVLLFTAVIVLIMFVPVLVKERPIEKRMPWTKGQTAPEVDNVQVHSWSILFKKVFKAFLLPTSIIFAIAAFFVGIGRGYMDATLPVFTVQNLGWEDEAYTQLFGISTVISGLIGMFLGGVLIDKLGKGRMITIIASILIPLVAAMFIFRNMWEVSGVMPGFMIVFYTLDTFLVICVFALAMQLCWSAIAATQFTLYMALYNLGASSGAWLMGQAKNVVDWQFMFLFSVVPALLVLVLIRFINIDKHKSTIASWK